MFFLGRAIYPTCLPLSSTLWVGGGVCDGVGRARVRGLKGTFPLWNFFPVEGYL